MQRGNNTYTLRGPPFFPVVEGTKIFFVENREEKAADPGIVKRCGQAAEGYKYANRCQVTSM